MAPVAQKSTKAVDTRKAVMFKLDAATHKKLRQLAYVEYDCTVGTLVAEAVDQWFKTGKKVSKAFSEGNRNTEPEEIEEEETDEE